MATAQAFILQLHTLDSVQLDSLDAVLECIETPLNWFGSISPSEQLLIVRDSAWKKHLWTVFHDILPAWTMSLTRPSLFNTLWIETENPELGTAMIKSSLPVLLECLSQDLSLDVLEIYAAALKRLAFAAFPLYQYLETSDTTFICTALCSIPGRLSNLLGSIDHAAFYAQWAQLIAKYPSRFSGELLAKIIRQGHQGSLSYISKKQKIGILIILRKEISMPILLSAMTDPSPFPKLFEHTATLVSSDTLYKSLLEHVPDPNLLSQLLFGDLDHFLECALIRLRKWSFANDRLAKLAVAAAVQAGLEDLESIKLKVIQIWSDPVFIKHASRHEKEYITLSVLVLLGYTEHLEMTHLVKGVSFYFEQGERSTAQLGALVAEAVSSKLDKEPLNTGLLEGDGRLLSWKKIIFDAKEVAPLASAKPMIQIDPILESEDELDPDADYQAQESDEDEFQAYAMDEESDDEGNRREPGHKRTKRPADLVRYLQDKEDPVKLEIGLNAAESMIRQSANNGSELEESCELLARHLIAFPENYEIDNFKMLQQKSLIALMASVPSQVAVFVIDAMYDRNTSVGQSQVILASISLAVRELAGWEATEEAPVQSLTQQLGTSLFVSKRIELEKTRKKTVKNRLAGIAGPVFFFPLLVGWWEGARGHLKHWIGNHSLLIERFIMTLNIILHCSTNIPDKRSIVREYFEFALSMRYTNISCKKALLLGIQVIVMESYKDQETLLFQDYLRELSDTKEWLDDLLENPQEDSLKELALRILVRLSQINQQQLLKLS
ncbi:telomere length regulation protein-domain-containing protein [Sporodiniella umbellata]|nr:telomere length regulation protein-domain-containing protein [Sporodiniella umbellata]